MFEGNYIEHLIIASLMSAGEINRVTSELQIPFNNKKMQYMMQIIIDHNLGERIRIEPKRGQLVIHSCNKLISRYHESWYENNEKVFSKKLDPKIITFESIILCIILFGSRKLEFITIPTSIHKDYLRTLIFCISHHLNVPILPASNQIKIANIPDLFLSTTDRISVIDGVELSDFLTPKEKNTLIKVEKA